MGSHRRSSQLFNKAWALAALMSAIGLCSAEPAKAFIPYVFTPSTQELEGAGIGIGRTAAQLLRLGQPKEAARLAALAVRLQPNDERLWSVLG